MLNIIWICRLFVVIDQNVDMRMFTRLVSAMQVYWWGWGLLSDISDLVTSLPPFLPPHHTHSDQWRLFNMFSGSGRTQWCSPESWPSPSLSSCHHSHSVSQTVHSYHFLFVTENLTNNKYPQPQPADLPLGIFCFDKSDFSRNTRGETRETRQLNFNQLGRFSRHLL